MTTVALPPAEPTTGPTPSKKRGRGGSTLWRYLVIRFLLIFPTVFILVTMVFVLMRITGDPITIALGGKLPPDQLAERIHQAGYDSRRSADGGKVRFRRLSTLPRSR